MVAWVDQARKDVLLRVFGPGGEPRRPEPVNVSRSPGVFSWLPRVATAPGDPSRVHVLWQEIVFSGGSHGGEAFHARSVDGGRTFGDPANLSRSAAGDGKGRFDERVWFNGSLDLATAPGGRVLAAWTAHEGPLWLARSSDGGASFSDPARVGGSGDVPARAPDLAAGPGDTVRLAWGAGAGEEGEIRVAVSVDGGRSFGPSRPVHPSGAHDDAPALVRAVDGTLHLAWGRSEGGPFRPSRLLYARTPADRAGSDAGSAGFGPPRPLAGAHAGRFASVDFPELAPAGGDTLLALWSLFPDGPRLARGLGLGASVDGGETFSAPAVVPGSRPGGDAVSGSLQGFYRDRLAVGPDGAVALVFSTFRRDESSRVWLLRGRVSEIVAGLAAADTSGG